MGIIHLYLLWFLYFAAFENVFQQQGVASYYSRSFTGRTTANGEILTEVDFTAAHRKLPFNTLVKVSHLRNGRTVVVRINDRGPYAKNRIIDLSRAAAKRLDMMHQGVAKVDVVSMDLIFLGAERDSILRSGTLADALGQPKEFSKTNVYAWETGDLRHALYTIVELYLRFNKKETYVQRQVKNGKEKFCIYMTNFSTKAEAKKMTQKLKFDGYEKAMVVLK